MISIEATSMWQQAGFLARVFQCFKDHHVSIDLVATSETNISLTLDKNAALIDEQTIEELLKDLNTFSSANTQEGCAAVSLVGRNIRSIIHKVASALEVFEDKQIYLISQSASDLNFTFVIDETESHKIITTLHALFFAEMEENEVFGRSWNDLIGGNLQTQEVESGGFEEPSKLNLGSGLGVVEKPGQTSLNVHHVERHLQRFLSTLKTPYTLHPLGGSWALSRCRSRYHSCKSDAA